MQLAGAACRAEVRGALVAGIRPPVAEGAHKHNALGTLSHRHTRKCNAGGRAAGKTKKEPHV